MDDRVSVSVLGHDLTIDKLSGNLYHLIISTISEKSISKRSRGSERGDAPLQPGEFASVVRPLPVFAQVATQLIQAIVDGRFAVGARLPSEQVLAEHFGVSRPSVREALSCLQFEGYVEPRRGSGTVVLADVVDGGGPWAKASTSRHGVTALDLIEARLVIETSAVAMAAVDPHPEGLGNLQDILTGMQLSLSEPDLHPQTDLGVHTALVRVCRNRPLSSAAERLLRSGDDAVTRSVRARAWDDSGLPWDWLGHHEEMASAVIERDPDRAAHACRVHLVSVVENLSMSTTLTAAERERVDRIVASAGPRTLLKSPDSARRTAPLKGVQQRNTKT